MKNFAQYFKINEDLNDDVKDKLSNDYKSLKSGILELLENTVEEPDKLLNVQNYMDDYINNDDVILENFVENNDIYEFYLAYQSDIDSILSDNEFYDKNPSELSIFSLYDYVIEGTKESVKLCMEEMYNELFEVEE